MNITTNDISEDELACISAAILIKLLGTNIQLNTAEISAPNKNSKRARVAFTALPKPQLIIRNKNV